MRAASNFFAVRGAIRTRFAQGKRLDPSKWLRVETMRFIETRDRPSMSAVAEYLSITAPSATSLIRGLVTDGLVRRTVNPRDRRASELALTEKGQTELKTTMRRGTTILAEIFGTLSHAELEAFTETLERIRRAAGEEC